MNLGGGGNTTVWPITMDDIKEISVVILIIYDFAVHVNFRT